MKQINFMSFRNQVSGYFVLIICASILVFSCRKRVTKDTEESVLADSIVTQLSILQDSLNNSWKIMIDDDDEKIQFMRRLLDEVSYSNYHMNRYHELVALVDSLKAMRYDRKTVKNSKLIDKYDSATSEVTRQVIEFCYDYPEYRDNDMMKELVGEINQKNTYVLLYRVHYDKFAEEINKILEAHGDKINDDKFDKGKRPLFKLSPEEI